MKPTGRLVALLCLAIALGACTGGDGGSTGATGASTISEVPTPAQTFTGAPGTATYEYANEGLVVTVGLDGSDGTLEVANDSEHDLGPPGLYVEDAVDGHEIDGEVADSAPVAAGETATFDVRLDGITVDDIGLLVLLFGADNYGAFVRTA
ncbi:MAG TPA: hypothetical protein VFU18_06815 [Actinomycetota bacterium]|jgi:hypothetical protein|nr:hypothetical protein [Actinomycetota bacterium]